MDTKVVMEKVFTGIENSIHAKVKNPLKRISEGFASRGPDIIQTRRILTLSNMCYRLMYRVGEGCCRKFR